jgi:hippurate hydrolase
MVQTTAPFPAIGMMAELAPHLDSLVALRHDLHTHPEIGLEETRTSAIVARELAAAGFQVTTGIAKTGVVGTLKLGSSRRAIGIRADIDALPIHEATGLPYASRTPGTMHACGHDGHTAMLLGAARLIAQRQQFDGTLHLIFQPAEENYGGARLMVEDGLLTRFACDQMFALHNEPGQPIGQLGFRPGPIMAAVEQVQITLTGKGGHGASPQDTIDPVVAGASLVMALQSIVARNVDPLAAAVITVGCLKAGAVCNVIPETAFLDIGIRYFDKAVGDLLRSRINACAHGQAASFGVTAECAWMNGYPVTVNDAAATALARSVGAATFGEAAIVDIAKPFLGSEDFSFILEQRPGSYLMLGNGDSRGLHNDGYDFNDAALPYGAVYWTALAERALALG